MRINKANLLEHHFLDFGFDLLTLVLGSCLTTSSFTSLFTSFFGSSFTYFFTATLPLFLGAAFLTVFAF
jgi:hypothetical protein